MSELSSHNSLPHVPCAGGIVFDAERRLLLIRRGRPPSVGRWSVPGGRCLPGEAPADACIREVAEETGLTVRIERLAGRVERAGEGATVYEIDDFVCTLVDPHDTIDRDPAIVPRPGDDAIDVRWVTRTDLDTIDLVPLLRETLAAWRCLPD